MAYAAVVSLKHTIEHLADSSHISIVPRSAKLIILAFELQSFKKVVYGLDSRNIKRNRMNVLEAQIRDAVSEFEDLLESHVLSSFTLAEEKIRRRPLLFLVDLQQLNQDIDSFIQMVNKMKQTYILHYQLTDEDIVVPSSSSSSSIDDPDGNESKMVGLSDQYTTIKDLFTSPSHFSEWMIIPLCGMPGIGKTTIAKKLLRNPLILNRYHKRAFVTIGATYQYDSFLLDIIKQVNPEFNHEVFVGLGDQLSPAIEWVLRESLKDWKYLIVLDDVWRMEIWNDLRDLFPRSYGSRILLTTRLKEVASSASPWKNFDIRFLDKKESWDLLREKVFGEDESLCPREFVKAGKKIAENCEGLPLLIVTVAKLLVEAEMTPEYWNEVAEKNNSSVLFRDANDQISGVLYPSYDYLPQHLKACFLYLGAFPHDCKISISKLAKLWNVEVLHEQSPFETLEHCIVEYLGEFISRNIALFRQWSTKGRIKTCGLHTVFWHLCNRVAGNNKFFHVLNTYTDASEEEIKNQRRLSIHNNVLFGIKDVNDSFENNCASTARSLVCFGPYHKYPVPLPSGLRLLRVLDALTIRFYEFPVQVLDLVQLRYLALTYNGDLPGSISKLLNLECLIVRQHLDIVIKSAGSSSYLPMEIWDMKELKHLQVMGSDLPHPREGSFLPNLSTLSDASIQSCTKDVLERIPHLSKLGIRIELGPDHNNSKADQPWWRCFANISHLHGLQTLKCVIVNPQLEPGNVAVVPPDLVLSNFPPSLRRLTLSGFGFPWEEMRRIASSLPNLEHLKLRSYAFRGPEWENHDHDVFMGLKSLVIEETDVVQWRASRGCFPRLGSLSTKHCYKLQEIPPDIFHVALRRVEVVDCSSSATISGKQIIDNFFVHSCYLHSSWDLNTTAWG